MAVWAASAWPASAQGDVRREGGGWVRMIAGTAPADARLRVVGHGPVVVDAGGAKELTYTVNVKMMARSEAEARQKLSALAVQVTHDHGTTVVTVPGGEAMSTTVVRAPHLAGAEVSTSDGRVDVRGVDGPVVVKSRAGELYADRIHGDCDLATGGGAVLVGRVDGHLHCNTGAGRIEVKAARGHAVLVTEGGDIRAGEMGGAVTAQTRGGSVHIASAGGAVNATSGGGEIVVDRAAGQVSARNMAGPVRVTGAGGVHCVSTGAVALSNISGAMNVSTAMGSIFASLLGSKLADSLLVTGNGDVTVAIPARIGVTIRAVNQLSDSLRRIVSDYPGVQIARRGTQLVAEGKVNGGGALLEIHGMGGAIYIRRQ